MLITISRQFAAGGSKVASEVAERLGWRLVDNDFVQKIADRAGVTPEEVAAREERPSTFIERLARITALEIPEMFLPTSDALEEHGEAHFVRLTRLLVEELAAEQRCVVVGVVGGAKVALEPSPSKLALRTRTPAHDLARVTARTLVYDLARAVSRFRAKDLFESK